MGLAVGHQGFPGGQIPLPPGGDHLDTGLQCVGAELEPHLVIALAGGAVGDGVGAGLVGDLDQALGDQGAGDGSAQQVLALVYRVGAEHGEYEVPDKFLAQVVDIDFLDTHGLRFGASGLNLLALADIGGKGDNLALVVILQPAHDDRGIEAAGIGQDHFLDI